MEIQERLDKLQLELNNLRNEVKKSELKYPIYCKSVKTGKVVKFTSLTEGEVFVNNIYDSVGTCCNNWINHTNTDVWQQLEVCPETGFFDGQAVWCWDDDYTHGRSLRFYNVKRKGIYNLSGEKANSYTYDNYKPFEGNYTAWMLKAFETLER